ncbi:MAG: hypothetical protein E7Z96_01910 [Actinomycetaceae bacterium]|nr:hypothetical protein [Actinomycetaceae bacterium]
MTGILPTASASDLDGTVVGGWSEDGGYYTVSAAADSGDEIMPVTGKPGVVRHTGRSERTTIRGTTHKRSHGWTTWRNVYHYTTATLEHQPPYGGVITSSGRQWGWHGTEAKTKWTPFNPHLPSGGIGQARTYYGVR